MKDRGTSKDRKPAPAEEHRSESRPAERDGFGESLGGVLRRDAAEAAGGATPEGGDRRAPTLNLRPTTSDRLEAFVEWLLSRCVGDGSGPPRAPVFLGEGERRLIQETADSIGRELFGASRAEEGSRLVLRFVLDLCTGAPCAHQRAAPGVPPEECPGPDAGPRHPGEVGHLCVGGPLRLERPGPASPPTADRKAGWDELFPAGRPAAAKGKK